MMRSARTPHGWRAHRVGALGGRAFSAVLCLGLVACGGSVGSEHGASPEPAKLPYATHVVSFDPGPGAGFGQDKFPNIVLGPPSGVVPGRGSLDVLSLGKGGSIVLGFEPWTIEDGPGPDLVVFENPFWPNDDPSKVYAEPGEVSVSEDGDTWLTFPCDAAGDGDGHFAGCAGVTPTLVYDPQTTVPLDPAVTGGDVFDLADLELGAAKYVMIRDVSNHGDAPTAGFDLDAVGIVNALPADSP